MRIYKSLLYILSIQQPSVLSNLQLQPCLDVQKYLVICALSLDVCPHLAELSLQTVDKGLELAQLQTVAGLCFCQCALQGRFLHETKGGYLQSTNRLVCHLFLILLLEGNCYL